MPAIATFFLYCGIILIVVWGMSQINRSNDNIIVWVLLSAALCGFFAALRGDAGSDSGMYRTVFEHGPDAIFRWVEFEPGFLALVNIFRFLGLPYQVFFFFMEFSTMLFLFLPVMQERKVINVPVTVFIIMSGFYFYSWNIMRQAFAIAICTYAMFLYMDKKKKQSILLIFMACLFHKSAMIVFVVVFAKILFGNRYSQYFMVIVFAIALYLVTHRDVFGKLVEMITGSGYYADYILRDAETDGSLLKYYVKYFPVLLITTLAFQSYASNPQYMVFYGLMVCGYILSSLGSVTATDVQRMGWYFTYLNAYVLGYAANKNIPWFERFYINKKVIRALITVYCFVIFTYDFFIRGFCQIVPYSWFI